MYSWCTQVGEEGGCDVLLVYSSVGGGDVLLVYSSWERRRCTAGVLNWRKEEERCTAGRLKWRRIRRRCTVGVLNWRKEEERCTAVVQSGGGDVLLVGSSGGG